MSIQGDAIEISINEKFGICYEQSFEKPTDLCQAVGSKDQLERDYSLQAQNYIIQYDELDLNEQIDRENLFFSVHQSEDNNQEIQSQIVIPQDSPQEEEGNLVNQYPNQFLQDSNSLEVVVPQSNQQIHIQARHHTKKPGETKNLPKCFARRIKEFILNTVQQSDDPELKNILNHQDVKQFFKIKPEKINKNQLDQFLSSEIGSMFCQEFFGNCRWVYGITKEGKTDVDICFRYNIFYYQTSLKRTKIN